LNIEKHPVENHELKITVTMDADEFEPMKLAAARKIAKQVKIPGFRPGKAPYEIIRRNYGDAALAQEALDTFLEKEYSKLLSDNDIRPGGMGRLDKIDQIDPPIFSLTIPLEPTVDLKDYREIREEFEEVTLSDEEKEETLTQLKTQFATEEPTEGPAKEGQIAYVLIQGELEDEKAEGGKKEFVKERPFEVRLGQDGDEKQAWPYVNYSDALIGANPGDVIETEYTFPEDAPIAAFKNKKAFFKTTIQSLKELVLPEEDLELASKYGEYESFDAFKEDVEQRLLDQKKRKAEDDYIEKLVNRLIEGAEIHYAPSALEEESQSMIDNIQHQLSHQKLDLETYLKIQNKDMETYLNEEVKPNAEKQLRRKLVIEEFAKKEKIQIDLEKFKKAVGEIEQSAVGNYQRAKNKRERDAITNQITTAAMNQSFSDTLFERLVAIGKGENPEIEPVKPETAETESDLEDSASAPDAVEVKTDETITPPVSEESDESKTE
jgi:trigger factor